MLFKGMRIKFQKIWTYLSFYLSFLPLYFLNQTLSLQYQYFFWTHLDGMRLSSKDCPLYDDQGDIWFCLRPAASGTTFGWSKQTSLQENSCSCKISYFLDLILMFEIKLFICIFFILHSFSRENTKCSSLCLVQQQKVTAIFLKKNWNTLSLTESAIFQEFVNSGFKGMAYRLILQSE